MPPPPGKRIGAIASMVFPKRLSEPGYKSFLSEISAVTTGNRRTLAMVEKEVVDKEYERLLRARYSHDEKIIRRGLEEVSSGSICSLYHSSIDIEAQARSKASKERYRDLQKLYALPPKPSDTAGDVAHLSLPKIGRKHGSTEDVFDQQKYADFAVKAERKNPTFAFTKDSMDAAFKLEAAQAHKSRHSTPPGQFDRMMNRVSVKFLDI